MISGWLGGKQDENPGATNKRPTPKSGRRRPRLRRSVFGTQGGGAAVGEVQAENPPGINLT